jgi:hypothetical protein
VLDGESLSSVASSFNLTRQALRRHRASHMTVTFSEGLSAWETLLRMAAAADRLHDLADTAEEHGRIADATRATLSEIKALDLMLALGVQGPAQLNYAADAAALELAITVLLQRSPALGDQLAEQLDQAERPGYANRFRIYADRCRALPEHHVSGNELERELNHAD